MLEPRRPLKMALAAVLLASAAPARAQPIDFPALGRVKNPFAALEFKLKQCRQNASSGDEGLEAQSRARQTRTALQQLEADPKSKPITPVARAFLKAACQGDGFSQDCGQAAACLHDALQLYLKTLSGPHGLPLKMLMLPQQAIPLADVKTNGKDFAADLKRAADGYGDPVDYATTAGAALADLNPKRWTVDQAEAKFNPDEEATQRTEDMLGHDLDYKKNLTQAELFCLALDANKGSAVKAAGTVAEILHNHRTEYPSKIWGMHNDGKDYYRYVGLYFELQPGLLNKVEEAAGAYSATVVNGAAFGTSAGFKAAWKYLEANSGGVEGPVGALEASGGAVVHGARVGWTQAKEHSKFDQKMTEFYTGVCAADDVRDLSAWRSLSLGCN